MKTRANGFSLVELMVAVTISMVAMIAVVAVYSSTRQTNRVQGMQTRLTEDGRFALSMLQRIVSQAGYRQNPTTALGTAFVSGRVSVSNAGVLTVRFDPDGTNQISCNGAAPAAGAAQTLVIQKNGSKLECATNAAAADEWIAPATSGTGNGSEVVDFALQFGLDNAVTSANFGCASGFDCIADQYVSSATASLIAAPALTIVAVKVCLVLKSEAMDMSLAKPAEVKDCGGGDIANSQTDHRLYRTFLTTVSLKNR
jgi:Tfp pilus assembly protein PilW